MIMKSTQILNTEQLGHWVRQMRKALGLRQDQLAGVAGVGLRFIVDLEKGKATAQIGKVLQVLATLGCSVTVAPPAGIHLEPQADGDESGHPR